MSSNEEDNPFAMDPEEMRKQDRSEGPEPEDAASGEPPDSAEPDEDQIDLEEPAEETAPHRAEKPAGGRPGRGGKPIPVGIPLEDDEPRRRSVKDLDVCPNCGEPMRGSRTLVCMRCGFDMKTMKVVKTEVGQIEEEIAETKPPLCASGRGDLWLPGAAAIISLLVLLIAYLIGYDGLFPPADEMAALAAQTSGENGGAVNVEAGGTYSLPFSTRMTALVRFVAVTVFWTGCGLASLLALSRLTERPFGDVRLAAVRTAAIMTTMALVGLIGFGDDYYYGELAIEIILRAALAGSVAMLLFALNVRETATAGGMTIIMAVLLYWGAVLITL